MATRINPALIDDLAVFGAEDVQKCYHCGNCTATCPFSKEPFIFPRSWMRKLQMGLEPQLKGSIEPWLCYYCGECSEECPREAQPGETMMALRRWLTSQYDFTGISRLMYKSATTMWTMIIVVALAVGAAMVAFGGNINVFDPSAGENVFIDSHVMHTIDLIGMGILLVILLINAFRMWKFIILDDKSVRVPFTSYLRKILEIPVHFLTQKRYRECENKTPWWIHLSIVVGYIISFVLIVLFLTELQGPEYNTTVHVFGYIATAFLLFGCGWAIIGRIRKSEEHYKFSHHTDWAFAILLFLTALTGILTHALHRGGMPLEANIMYVVHMMVDIPWFVLIIPFSKWSHLIYRPLAMFFAAVKEEALIKGREPAAADLSPQAA
jgi:ferredoxin